MERRRGNWRLCLCTLAAFETSMVCRESTAVEVMAKEGGRGASDAPIYRASGVHGGIDRILIMVTDPRRNLCIKLILAGAEAPTVQPVRAPPPFTFEAALLFVGLAACADATMSSGGLTADRASGEVSWSAATRRVFPETLNVHVTLSFPGTASRAALSYRLDSDHVAVTPSSH